MFIILWPVGIPLLYACLLLVSREAFRTGRSTSLSHAITFLAADCTPFGLKLRTARGSIRRCLLPAESFGSIPDVPDEDGTVGLMWEIIDLSRKLVLSKRCPQQSPHVM